MTTTTQTEAGGLAAALAAFQRSVPTATKDKAVNAGQKRYRYADLASVAEVAYPLLAQHGLAFSCLPRQNGHGGYELSGRLLHTSGESLESALPIHGVDAQAIGSSLTYMRRYLLGCMTGLVTDEDDDGAAATARPAPARVQADPLSEAKKRAWEATKGRGDNAARQAALGAWLAERGLTTDTATVGDFDDFANGVTNDRPAPAAAEAETQESLA